jgi:K+/H+ antiporter YhaU regulatory subunit KhtT
MSLELLTRIQQELSITGSAIHETVLAIAERVNRKVQVLRLHSQAAQLLRQIEQVHSELGRQIAALSSQRIPLSPTSTVPPDQLEQLLSQAGSRIQQLKHMLTTVDSQIRELRLETTHHELLTLQQDLSLRAAAIERFPVIQGAPVIGKPLAEMGLPASIRLVTIIRGPFLLPPDEALALRIDDVAVMIGPQSDLALVASWFTQARNAKPA